MRLNLDPRARRLVRRVPRTTVYTAMELILLSLLAVQCARLLWMMVTPVGPIGDWKAPAALRPARAPSTALLGSFDPFFRLGGNAPGVVTGLNLKLFGVREDRASGRGSAIIATPDGQQRSFAVGDEIVPGVTLTAVGFDSVTISRNGTAEQLFLDQSLPAPVATPPAPAAPLPMASPAARPLVMESITSGIEFQPRMKDGAVAGVAVQPRGSGDAFRAAGFAPGDVILSVNGQRIVSVEQARALAARSGGGEVAVQVERAGRIVPLRVRAGQ